MTPTITVLTLSADPQVNGYRWGGAERPEDRLTDALQAYTLDSGQRICTRCDQPYPVGGYRTHKMLHEPIRPSRAGRPAGARDKERATAIALEVALGIRSLESIAGDHGITRERVRQIAKREGVSRQHKPRPGVRRVGVTNPCLTCGTRVPTRRMREHRLAAGHAARFGSRVSQVHLDLMREFYDRGMGYFAIGGVMGLPAMTIKYHLVRMDGFVPHATGQYERHGVIPALRRELAEKLARLAEQVA